MHLTSSTAPNTSNGTLTTTNNLVYGTDNRAFAALLQVLKGTAEQESWLIDVVLKRQIGIHRSLANEQKKLVSKGGGLLEGGHLADNRLVFPKWLAASLLLHTAYQFHDKLLVEHCKPVETFKTIRWTLRKIIQLSNLFFEIPCCPTSTRTSRLEKVNLRRCLSDRALDLLHTV